ncbi:MAG: GNAT family N-acetyltransferase [Clostridia bacterium]|nr:GNAT family N-acetyltransferase [Clostridia bacterium]
METSLTISKEKISIIELYQYFQICKDDFPSLGDEKFVEAYAQKLSEYANFMVARTQEGEIGAMVIYYANQSPTIFITHVYTRPQFRRRGLVQRILDLIMQKESDKDFNQFKLEVLKCNYPAIRSYEKYGFKIEGETETKYKMKLEY